MTITLPANFYSLPLQSTIFCRENLFFLSKSDKISKNSVLRICNNRAPKDFVIHNANYTSVFWSYRNKLPSILWILMLNRQINLSRIASRETNWYHICHKNTQNSQQFQLIYSKSIAYKRFNRETRGNLRFLYSIPIFSTRKPISNLPEIHLSTNINTVLQQQSNKNKENWIDNDNNKPLDPNILPKIQSNCIKPFTIFQHNQTSISSEKKPDNVPAVQIWSTKNPDI